MKKTFDSRLFLPRFFLLLISTLCFAGGTHFASAETKSHYIKIGPNEKQSLILEFSGDSLKVAESVEKLKDAKPVKCQKRENSNKMISNLSPQITLKFPVRKGEKPIVSIAQMNMLTHSRGTTLVGMLTTDLKDKKGNTWTYKNRLFTQPVTDVSKAKLLSTLSSEKVDLKITNRLDRRDKKKMGVAVQLVTASGEVSSVRKGKTSATAKVTLTDPDGKTSEVVKTLSKLGYG